MPEVTPGFKENIIECPCGCGAFGVPTKNGHPKRCPDSCAKCRGRRNRAKGKRAERDMRKRVGVTVATTMHAAIGEEAWSHPVFRDECKAGAQVGPIATRFLLAEKQAEQNKRIGDNRAFRYLARPDGMPGGLVCLRGDVWDQIVEPALREHYGYGGAA